MKTNRRYFVKSAAFAGAGTVLAGTGISSEVFGAPSLLRGKDDRIVRLGWIGVGGHGTGVLKNALKIPYVEIPAICDIKKENLENARKLVADSGRKIPEGYGEHEESYKDMVLREDIDGVVIITPWETHIPMALAALAAGKYTSVAAGPANSIEECWDLVEASERSGKPCMLLENHCYDRWNMAILNMVRMGLFGELVHASCGYLHELRERLVLGKGTGVKAKGEGDYRSLHNQMRNGDLYPTHGIGPVCQWFNILRGNILKTG